jgi:hypothetical protein
MTMSINQSYPGKTRQEVPRERGETVSKKTATIHLFGDLSSDQTMCGLLWKNLHNHDDYYTLEVNHFLAGQWYTKHLISCPRCITALEKKIETYHTKHQNIKNLTK